MKTPPFFTVLFASAMFTLSVSQGALGANSTNVLPTEQSLKADLANAQKMSEGEAKNTLYKHQLIYCSKFKLNKKSMMHCKQH